MSQGKHRCIIRMTCRHDQHLLHTPLNVQAHKYFGGKRVVPAMVIKSGEPIALLAKLLGLQLYGVSLPTLSFAHWTAALQPLTKHIPGRMHERSYKCGSTFHAGHALLSMQTRGPSPHSKHKHPWSNEVLVALTTA